VQIRDGPAAVTPTGRECREPLSAISPLCRFSGMGRPPKERGSQKTTATARQGIDKRRLSPWSGVARLL